MIWRLKTEPFRKDLAADVVSAGGYIVRTKPPNRTNGATFPETADFGRLQKFVLRPLEPQVPFPALDRRRSGIGVETKFEEIPHARPDAFRRRPPFAVENVTGIARIVPTKRA